MTIARGTRILGAALAALASASPFALGQDSHPASACPVTYRNGRGLVAEPGKPPLGNHGNDARTIATALGRDGTVTFKPGGPGCVDPDGTLGMKFHWWRGVSGRLSIEGRRLDGDAPPLGASIPDGYGPIGFQATGLRFPTAGCWEVTGRVGEESLTFVVHVVKVGPGPAPVCRQLGLHERRPTLDQR